MPYYGGSSARKCEAASLFGRFVGTKALVGTHHYVWARSYLRRYHEDAAYRRREEEIDRDWDAQGIRKMTVSRADFGASEVRKCEAASIFNRFLGAKTLVVMHHDVWVSQPFRALGSLPAWRLCNLRCRCTRQKYYRCAHCIPKSRDGKALYSSFMIYHFIKCRIHRKSPKMGLTSTANECAPI